MLISIIIPVYNVAGYIEACLKSAFNQTYKNTEIILIDDAATDSSMVVAMAIIESYSDKDKVSIITHSQNKGLSAARNTGLKAAKGEYVYFLDSDDYMPDGAIETLANAAKKHNPTCVVGDYRCSVETGRYYPELLLKEGLYHQPEILDAYIHRKIYMMAQNKLYKRDVLLSESLFFRDGLLHEDELFSFQFMSVCESLYVVKEVTFIYVIRESSITNTISFRNFEHWLTILEEMAKWINDHPALQSKEMFFYFEDQKNIRLRNLIRQNIDNHICRDYYIRLRDIHYKTPRRYILSQCAFRKRKRLLHYLFNPSTGYKVHRFMMK